LPARCAHLGELARQRAASFTVEAMVESTLAIHQDVCAVPATLSAA
jgi:hypothetical protein